MILKRRTNKRWKSFTKGIWEYGVSDVIKDMQKRNLSAHYSRPRLKDLRLIAIDKFSIGRGYRYLTVVFDLISGAVVFVGNGNGTEALAHFWKILKIAKAKIEAVAMNMSPSYI